MIDITTEQVFSLTEATYGLPKRRGGKRPHVATLYRWAQRGHKGVRLETVQIGGTKCTSKEALQRFFTRLTNDEGGGPIPAALEPHMTSTQKAIDKELDRLGL